MNKILLYADDILLAIGCVLTVFGSYIVNPILAIFVAAAECFIVAYIIGQVPEQKGGPHSK
ncbi:hypothetical protein [Megasphaera vaginalis (ex Srinivasan et al. 2021)]|uniref:DUF1056 family protein n=1 Tax=Megasphaera vaginalis (ex Srinivasan et al. 2021) TaxID=1111454 RepID=U7USE4_9FIRM|nr:hypothetical protein [Megasphaera vaginalis (ex Srinivasan et al. 2021)]ERT62372.1 hypothetical protein HMPREF1250_0248 [Megasphaera vaginalis (ex Srinivasan et al. 2021)]